MTEELNAMPRHRQTPTLGEGEKAVEQKQSLVRQGLRWQRNLRSLTLQKTCRRKAKARGT